MFAQHMNVQLMRKTPTEAFITVLIHDMCCIFLLPSFETATEFRLWMVAILHTACAPVRYRAFKTNSVEAEHERLTTLEV